MLDAISKRGVLYVFKDSNWFASVVPFAVVAGLFIAFVLVHSFAVWRLGALDETFKVMRHSVSHDCNHFLMIWSNFTRGPTLLVNHCKFPILQQSNTTVVLTIPVISKPQAGTAGTEHGLGEPGGLPLLIIMFCQSIPSCNVSWIQDFYPFPTLHTVPHSHTTAGVCSSC